MKIKLQELADALAQSDVRQGYVDIPAGRVVLLDEDISEADAFEHAMKLEEEWEKYVMLPNVVDEYAHDMMRAFAEQCGQEERKRLLAALTAAGASSRFHHLVRELTLEEEWRRFQTARLLDIARDFCEENRIEFEEK